MSTTERPNRRTWLVNWIMLVLFVSWAYFQFNDPDAWPWVAIYGVAALCCLLYAFGRLPRLVPLLIAAGAGVWAVVLAVQVIGRQPIFEEQGREMMGLLIVAGWLGWLARVQHRSPTAPREAIS